MTENEERLEELKDAVCRLVCIAEDAIYREGFEELDNAGAEIIDCLDELEQYRAIGTIEECRTAVERMKPKKPVYQIDTNGTRHSKCPNCESFGVVNYCIMCGQAI